MEMFNFEHFRITSLNPWFVTGLSQGEAAFTYNRNGKNLNIVFSIRLRADEKKLIDKLYDFFHVGRIYFAKGREPNHRSGLTKPSLYYRVSRVSDLERIIKHFDRFKLVGKKYDVYMLWKEMVYIKKNFRKPDLAKLNIMANQLSSMNPKSRVKNYG